jgi:N6-L-threonylcarbamoyladenine synthase
MGSLLVGLSMARGLSLRTGAPVLGVNHLEGHVLSPLVEADLATPFLALVVSGGHTTLYLVREIGDYAQVASTRDDAAGEAFDKGAKMLGLGYPGGRVIDETARGGDRRAIRLPRGRVKADPMALSFSGLKTALSLWLERGEEVAIADVCASFQEAIVDVLVDRTRSACARLDVPRVAVCGGVSANSRLREAMGEMGRAEGVSVVFPPMSLCTDNAAMIAHAAWRRLERGLDAEEPVAVSRLPLGPRLVLP